MSGLPGPEPYEIATVFRKRPAATKVLAEEGEWGAYTASRFGPPQASATDAERREAVIWKGQNRGRGEKLAQSL
jgi:hypothetical protein